MYPKITVNQKNIVSNLKKLQEACQSRNLDLVGVVKLVAGNLDVINFLVNNGLNYLGDSRIANLKKMVNVDAKKMLLRIPMPSEVDDVIKYSDICLISELSTLELLEQAAKQQNKNYEVILMIELGDIREGIWDLAVINQTVARVSEFEKVKLVGLGTNFACFGATVPELSKLQKLDDLRQTLEEQFKIKLPIISCGNSSHISIWDDPKMPKGINQIRSGSALLCGIGLNDEPIPFLQQNNFKLQAEIIELQQKPSASWGKKGLNAFGEEIQFEDIGIRKKAIIALGRQDVGFERLVPIDKSIQVIGQSSDHTILDLTNCNSDLKVGDIVEFDLDYLAILNCFTSEYVTKEVIK
ncbi:alanine racemase, N-terminal domain protein [Spiroplasma syrphidicola EA-1]|uniref:Alanine racemase, N-terminal domain protein n=1 Tax=Spiroplasma syrphidicola EA-1 TaxID=1276229 RepID=R4UKB5_9MOLU|nr:alanine/ornithine racemase family PLP-dependent enzyme [Spiroplasma syrphidicola]AGM25711.1 alanine racemase, N-terminal domain protein [Spiroplasma syrphidicola EA-1]